ncbi:hypothetical protein ABLE91_03140 [Aquabacter sp. CN5-332]|uniref:hypothetical protein n=1 Tax=Aquabacter sp. CN5-332 TaxID=3156608 RepID=UPI0032B38A4F
MARMALLGAALVAALLPGGAALALLAPQYYEQARREAQNVVVIAVKAVTPPSGDYGDCAVAGDVRRVERGAAYKQGQSVTVAVPCSKPGTRPPIGGTIYRAPEALRKAPFGRAYLDGAGALMLSQYEPLAALP